MEVILTKFFHAMGYWVPDDYLVFFDPARLEIRGGATYRTDSGDKRQILREDVEHWLRDQPRRPDGTIRALASRFIPGTPVGAFRYAGTRPDDFGSTLGSGSTSAQQPRGGYEYLIEGKSILKGLATLGFWQRGWTRVKCPDYPAVGNVEADFFEPWTWKTEYPQPAFARMDAADAFWAASIAAKFSDEMIRAIVRTGQISDARAETYLSETIITRRNKVVAYWISRTNPLDAFAVRPAAAGNRWRLGFDNAAVRAGAARPGAAYRIRGAAARAPVAITARLKWRGVPSTSTVSESTNRAVPKTSTPRSRNRCAESFGLMRARSRRIRCMTLAKFTATPAGTSTPESSGRRRNGPGAQTPW